MNLPKELITVTPTSKFLAMFLFLSVPFVAFFIGIRYGEFTKYIEYIESRSDIEQYMLQNQPVDPTADWESYTSEEFKVKYPNNYVFDFEDINSFSVFDENFANVEVGTISTEENISEYVNSYLEQSKNSFEGKSSLSVNKRSDLTVDENEAIQLELFYEALGSYGLETYIATDKNAIIYVQTIDFKAGSKLDNDVITLHNQILSTFRFIE